MGMGCTRVLERVLAATGKLEEAPSKFQLILDVPCAGVLWALPALLANGLVRHTKEYFELPKGFYGLLHIFMLLAFMALSRIKSIEQLRYNSAGEWGNLLGLDRIPEVRTLRKRIRHLSETGQVTQWSHTLSKEWMENDPGAAGILYVDGHVRVYHGSQTPLPKRYVSRQRLCLRGMMDTWVNDQRGLPFFVVSTPFSTHLLEMLRSEIVPRLLNDVPHQPSTDELQKTPLLHRFTLVFDREGYSPDFLKEMKEKRIACLTYHKFPKESWPIDEFQKHSIPFAQGQNVTIKLAERGTRLGKLWVREIRKLTETGHQTSILSTDYLSNDAMLAFQMFSRWSQENFFKYMMEHFNIDALADLQTQPLRETRPVINPAHRILDNQIKKEAALLGKKLGEFGRNSLQEEDELNAVSDYEIKKGILKEQIDILQNSLEGLKEKRKTTPKHISFLDLPPDEQFSQFSPTKKQMIDTIKMIAYRAETRMAELLKESMSKPDEARSLLRDLFTMEADLLPNETDHTLTVQLHHFTNPASDKIIQSLADHLNLSETIYPGTNLRMIFKMVSG